MAKTYKDSGVDKAEGYKTVEKIKKKVSATHSKNVLNGIGSFGAFYELNNYKNPVLVSGTDGVGTKIRIALEVQKYDSIGQDCVAMCVNDILCHGASPLFFLDYLACGSLDAEIASEIIGGVADACKQVNCSLIGGETAEMPGMYAVGDYDLAGFTVGAVEKNHIIDGKKISQGDCIIGLPSSGFHSNGFSLIRQVYEDYYEDWKGQALYETLLTPTRLYVSYIQDLMKDFELKGIAHITGGGLIENIPRILPSNIGAVIDTTAIEVPEIMLDLQKRGNISTQEMYETFNMGIGMVIVISNELEKAVLEKLEELSLPSCKIGWCKKTDTPIELLHLN